MLEEKVGDFLVSQLFDKTLSIEVGDTEYQFNLDEGVLNVLSKKGLAVHPLEKLARDNTDTANNVEPLRLVE